jgi:SNF2-related domain
MGYSMTFSWDEAARRLRAAIATDEKRPAKGQRLDDGQRASLRWIAEHMQKNGVILADEVGTGKTRIACAVVEAVVQSGGRAGIVVPRGLMHQWIQEFREVNESSSEAKQITSMREFRDSFLKNTKGAADAQKHTEWRKIAPAQNQPEWWLISHTFRSPQVRSGDKPAEWRIALPSYVRAAMAAPSRRNDFRTRVGRLLAETNDVLLRISQEINDRLCDKSDRQALRARLDRAPFFKRGGDNEQLSEYLRGDGEGRNLVEQLMGRWLGEFDLIVVDEAHKGREEVEVGEINASIA